MEGFGGDGVGQQVRTPKGMDFFIINPAFQILIIFAVYVWPYSHREITFLFSPAAGYKVVLFLFSAQLGGFLAVIALTDISVFHQRSVFLSAYLHILCILQS